MTRVIAAYPISGEDLMALPVKALGPAITYHHDVLGFSVVGRDARAATIARDEVRLGLIVQDDHEPKRAGSLALEVDNLDAMHQELERTGARPGEFGLDRWNDRSYRTFFVREDENGYCYCFYQPAGAESLGSNTSIGRWSSFGVFLIGVVYAVSLIIGFATRGLSAPIVDPLLGVMELLTLLAAPLMLAMMAAIHGRAPDERKTVGAVAFACMILTVGMTSAVHFVQLTAIRQVGAASLVWPSSAYAVELLAWDVYLGLSLVFAAFTFADSGAERPIRRGFLLCGSLCLLGAAGPAVGNMRLQLVGILGYGAVLPVVCLLLSRLFSQRQPHRGA